MRQKDLARNLKTLRARKGLTCGEMAKLAGVSGNTALRHEHGYDMTISQLFQYADALGCSVNDILYGPLDSDLTEENEARFEAEIEALGRKFGLDVEFTTRQEIYDEMKERRNYNGRISS